MRQERIPEQLRLFATIILAWQGCGATSTGCRQAPTTLTQRWMTLMFLMPKLMMVWKRMTKPRKSSLVKVK